jgi:hypothetical protein
VNAGNRILGAVIPESPARTLGEQLRLALQWRRTVAELPETDEPATPDPEPPDRED